MYIYTYMPCNICATPSRAHHAALVQPLGWKRPNLGQQFVATGRVQCNTSYLQQSDCDFIPPSPG